MFNKCLINKIENGQMKREMNQEQKGKTFQINEWLAELDISAYSLKGVFKRTPQQIHTAINSAKYPTLKDKIYSYLLKKVNKKRPVSFRETK